MARKKCIFFPNHIHFHSLLLCKTNIGFAKQVQLDISGSHHKMYYGNALVIIKIKALLSLLFVQSKGWKADVFCQSVYSPDSSGNCLDCIHSLQRSLESVYTYSLLATLVGLCCVK